MVQTSYGRTTSRLPFEQLSLLLTNQTTNLQQGL